MNRMFKLLLSLLTTLGLIWLLSSAIITTSAIGSDNPDGFEDKEFVSGLDLWINQTNAPNQGISLSSGEDINHWKLQRYILLPESVNLDEWINLDPNAIYVTNLWGPNLNNKRDTGPSISVSAQDIENDDGLTGFTGRETDGVSNVDANERTGDIGVNTVNTDFDSFNSTTSVDTMTGNYTVPDNDIRSGIAYDAGDQKDITEYATNVAEGQGESLNAVMNASIFGYAYSTFDDLQTVVLTMDQESANAPGQEAGILKRAKIFLKSKKVIDKVSNGFLGINSVSKLTDINEFKKIALANVAPGMPSGAKFFLNKVLPSAHWDGSKIGIAALTEGLGKRAGAIFGILLLIGTIALGVWYYRRNMM